MRMRCSRSAVLPLLLAVAAGVLGGCGHSSKPKSVIDHPGGARDAVVRWTDSGGMGTRESFFAEPPVLVVAGDGTAYLRMEEATMTGVVWPVVTFDVPESYLQSLLIAADDAGLLAAPADYTPPQAVQDATTTSVALDAGGGRWVHSAYALGDTTTDTDARERLQAFVDHLAAWARTPRHPAAQRLSPQALRILATPVEEAADPQHAGRWPAGADVGLAEVGECAVVRDARVLHLLTTRTDRLYRQDGEVYAVAAAVLLPGDSCVDGAAS